MKNVKINIIGWSVFAVATVLGFLFWNWLICPRIGWSFGLLATIALSLAFGAIGAGIVGWAVWDEEFAFHPAAASGILAVLIVLACIISAIAGITGFHVDAIMNRLDMTEVSQEELVEMLPAIDEDGAYSWADSATAHKLAARKTGELTEFVNIYVVGNDMNTTITNGKLAKYVPLKYAGVLKASKVENIPGYVYINPVQQKAEYMEHVIRYSPDAYFSYDLIRHARQAMPTEAFGRYTFQVSPEGEPVWVMELVKLHGWFVDEVYAVALINAETGNIEKYELDNAPAWVSCISGETAQEIYNGYGRMINGFWNLSGVGQTVTTDDFGYVAIDGEMYYTFGITANSNSGHDSDESGNDNAVDESNLGLMLYNAHTNKAYFCKIPGAEEYSAMEAAEGVVQNFGYEASFPSLTNVDGVLTYVMVLKDSNGIVKQYGMVNYDNYTVAVTADSLNSCRVAYAKALAKTSDVNVDSSTWETITITVDTVEYIVQNGETIVYVRDIDGNVYKSNFDENFLFVQKGSAISISVMDNGESIKMMSLVQIVSAPEIEVEVETTPENTVK